MAEEAGGWSSGFFPVTSSVVPGIANHIHSSSSRGQQSLTSASPVGPKERLRTPSRSPTVCSSFSMLLLTGKRRFRSRTTRSKVAELGMELRVTPGAFEPRSASQGLNV